MATVTSVNYLPYTSADLYKLMLMAKRDLITTEGLRWTAESPADPGIAILKVASEMGAQLCKWMDNRVSQGFLLYAVDSEPVHAACRAIGYKLRGPVASQLMVQITTTGAQVIPAGAKLEKTLEDGQKITFELLDEVIFTGAGSKLAYILQGETSTTSYTSNGAAFQKYVVPAYPIAYGSLIVFVGSNVWTEVANFLDSGETSQHYVVEYDYTGQPTVYFGDGEFGAKPGNGAIITVAWRTCDGAKGNVAPGTMQFVSNYAKVSGVTNVAGAVATLAENIQSTATVIEVEDDNSILSFKDSGVAYIDGDSFTYTGKSGNTFTGVTGLENSHGAGEEITYSTTYTYGMDKETNKQAKISAIQRNRMKTSAFSLPDYEYLVMQIPGVARVKASVQGNVITLQIVPADGGIPSNALKASIYTYLANRKGALHTVSVVNPNYVYVDVTAQVEPGPGYNYTTDVKPEVIETIQNYLDPLVKDDSSLYYLNGWGNLLKKNLLEADIFALNNRALVGDVEITVFKRSTAETGNSNIQLAEYEIAQVGSIHVTRKGVSAPIELIPGEMEGPSGSSGVQQMARVIL